jgi:hypothetical protein
MRRNGIKAARIQVQYSELNSSRAADPLLPVNAPSAVERAAAWLKTRLGGHRRTGRHAAPGRAFPNRRVAR